MFLKILQKTSQNTTRNLFSYTKPFRFHAFNACRSYVKDPGARDFRRIMVCHDGSIHADKALQETLHFANKKDFITVLRIVTPIEQIMEGQGLEAEKWMLEATEKMIEKEENDLKKWTTVLTEAGVSSSSFFLQEKKFQNEGLIATGDPRTKILEKVEELEIDTLVIASHGLDSLKSEKLGTTGSNSSYIFERAKCNVFVVKQHYLELL